MCLDVASMGHAFVRGKSLVVDDLPSMSPNYRDGSVLLVQMAPRNAVDLDIQERCQADMLGVFCGPQIKVERTRVVLDVATHQPAGLLNAIQGGTVWNGKPTRPTSCETNGQSDMGIGKQAK